MQPYQKKQKEEKVRNSSAYYIQDATFNLLSFGNARVKRMSLTIVFVSL